MIDMKMKRADTRRFGGQDSGFGEQYTQTNPVRIASHRNSPGIWLPSRYAFSVVLPKVTPGRALDCSE